MTNFKTISLRFYLNRPLEKQAYELLQDHEHYNFATVREFAIHLINSAHDTDDIADLIVKRLLDEGVTIKTETHSEAAPKQDNAIKALRYCEQFKSI